MLTKKAAALALTAVLGLPHFAEAGWGLFHRRPHCTPSKYLLQQVYPPSVPCTPGFVCPPGMVEIGQVSATTALEPIVVEETYTVKVPKSETVTDDNGNQRTVTRFVEEQRTRIRRYDTAIDQIEYLKSRVESLGRNVQGLDQNRVTPLEKRVENMETR